MTGERSSPDGEGRAGAPRPVFAGICAVCGWIGTFADPHPSVRESYRCGACRASFRYRHQAETLLHQFSRAGSASLAELCAEPHFARLHIYEAGLIGPFRGYLGTLPNYVQSFYWEDVPPGAQKDGVRCENLEALTFEDARFDLMITSDILEHVRHPLRALGEARRVLRPGGRYVFSIPVPWPWPVRTRVRVDVSGPEDVFIAEPRYHGSPRDPRGSLVYNDFGRELVEQVEALGFTVRVPRAFEQNLTFVAIRR